MGVEVGHDWARKMIQELCDLGHHGGTLMLYVVEQEHRDRRLAELEARLVGQPAPAEVCECTHCTCKCKRCNGFGDDEVQGLSWNEK